MENITSPQIAKFYNEKGRVLADLIERTRRTAEQFAVDIIEIEGLAAYSGAQDADVVIDGSETDGRNPRTKASLQELKYVAAQIVAAASQDDRKELVGAWSVNGQPAF